MSSPSHVSEPYRRASSRIGEAPLPDDALGPDVSDFESHGESSSWLAALVASSGEVIIGADAGGDIVVWNRGAADFYGYDASEVLSRPVSILRPPSHQAQLEDVLERLASGEVIPPFETQHVKKDGTVADVSVSVSPVKLGDGTVIGSSAIVRDISEMKRAQRDLERAVESERELVDKLRDLDRVRTSFVSSVSHELRTPLTSILGYLELLEDDLEGMNEHQQEMLDIVSRNSKRLLALIEDLLVLSRIESGAFRVLKEPVDVRALVNAVAREVGMKASESGHQLNVAVTDDVGSVLGDPSELERLLLSLVSNALKFTPAGGRITVYACRQDGFTTISVQDTGMGIPTEELSKVFDPFFRSEIADRRAIPGTGLGLPIAKTIVEQHGGKISCESEPGQGTRVTVTLPYAIQERRAS
jgi:PAS domain S-box-containing protein